MPILRVKEIRDMSSEDREKRLHELQTELVRLKTMIKAGGAVENPARVRELRKAVARVLTIQSEPVPSKEEEEKKESKKAPKKKEEKEKAKTEKKEQKKERTPAAKKRGAKGTVKERKGKKQA